MYILNSFVGVSHHPLGPKDMISVQYYLELVSTKNTISLRQGNLKKKYVSSIKPGMELRIFNGIIY